MLKSCFIGDMVQLAEEGRNGGVGKGFRLEISIFLLIHCRLCMANGRILSKFSSGGLSRVYCWMIHFILQNSEQPAAHLNTECKFKQRGKATPMLCDAFLQHSRII